MMVEAKQYDEFWSNIIKNLPRGGSYRFDERKEGYDKMIDLVPEGSKVFDYACGLSMVSIRLAKEKNCKVSGCDFSKVAVDFVKEQSGGDFRVTDELFGDNYDFIILGHFLEHIKTPVEFMKEVVKKCKKVIVSLPNNFRHIGEHANMQWSSWEDWNRMFKDFTYERVDKGYSKKTHHAWHHPIFLFEGENKMHPNYREEKPKKKVTKKKTVKKTSKKGTKKISTTDEENTVTKVV